MCPHFLSASSYSKLVLLNVFELERFRDKLWLIIFVSCFLICGGWFDDIWMYINLSFGCLYGRYVLFSKWNVLIVIFWLVAISILKSISLKILFIFFPTLSVCSLFIWRKINNPSSLMNPYYFWKYVCWERLSVYTNKIAEFLTIIAPQHNINCGISVFFLSCLIFVKQ